MFLRIADAIADKYPFIEYEQQTIDHVALDLALDPTPYDVLVMENLFGDVMSDLCAGLVGGLGVVPGANIGTRYAIFEAVHGTAPDIAGKNLANPLAVILSAVMLLRHVGQGRAAARLERAVTRLLAERRTLTR